MKIHTMFSFLSPTDARADWTLVLSVQPEATQKRLCTNPEELKVHSIILQARAVALR